MTTPISMTTLSTSLYRVQFEHGPLIIFQSVICYKPVSKEGFSRYGRIGKKHLSTMSLLPLQSERRSFKPCLVYGDFWDENTATDMKTGEPFLFDAGSFHAHNEYNIGNWRIP